MTTSHPRALAQWLAAAIATVACEAVSTQRPASGVGFETARKIMVDEQLAGRDIKDPRVLEAMRQVPRHEFVPEAWRGEAYADGPLPIGYGQTISQPYIVAYMSEALGARAVASRPRNRHWLRLPGGHLGVLAKEVYTIEIVEPLAERARAMLNGSGTRTCTCAPATATSAGRNTRRSIASW